MKYRCPQLIRPPKLPNTNVYTENNKENGEDLERSEIRYQNQPRKNQIEANKIHKEKKTHTKSKMKI